MGGIRINVTKRAREIIFQDVKNVLELVYGTNKKQMYQRNRKYFQFRTPVEPSGVGVDM